MEENYIIYKFTFADGKIYIGQTSEPILKRWKNGEGYKGQDVYVPIILEGWDNIKKEILHTNLTLEQANKLEKFYIKKYNSIINGYNRASGGKNVSHQRTLTININYSEQEFITQIIPTLSKNLNGNAFKLMCYFYIKNYQTIIISTNEISKQFGINKSSFSDSFNELIKKEYIKTNNNINYQLIL